MKKYDNVLLVTGGAGFIGSAFLRVLVSKYPNWYFINLDSLTYAGDLNRVKSIQDCKNYLFVQGDICNRSLLETLYEKYAINIVVNFAAESHVDNSILKPRAFIETNINGVYNLLDLSKKYWFSVNKKERESKYRFLQISTDEVYGSLEFNGKSWKEESCLAPNSPYSSSKASAEMLVMSYFKTYELPVLITRSSNNFGPFQNKEKLIPKIIDSVINNRPIPIYGDGKNIRDWIFVYDNVNALELVLLNGQIGHHYNIGGDNEISNLDLVHLIIGYLKNHDYYGTYEFVSDRLGHDLRYSIDSRKINQLGWNIKFDFEDSMVKTIVSYL